jgi:hypothetical protein
MAHANLVHIPLLPVLGDAVVVMEEVMSGVVAQGSWIKLCISGRDGHLLVGCPPFSHSAQGGWTHGESGPVGSFFFLLPQTAVVVLASGGEGGVVRVSIRVYIGIPLIWGGRDGWGTIVGGCRYHTRISRTILGRVSISATWKYFTPGGG